MPSLRVAPILLFIVLSYGLAWLAALPLWLHGGLAHPLFPLWVVLMMLTPAVSAIVVTKITEPGARPVEAFALNRWKPFKRLLAFGIAALAGSFAIHAVALLIGAGLGLYEFDLHRFSGMKELLDTKLAAYPEARAQLPPLNLLLVVQLVALVPGAIVNTLPALGEEIGWRSWLLPRLLPLGTFPALLISGVIWGLWHAPLILLGYNYGDIPWGKSLLCMTLMCVALTPFISWLRLSSLSVWPAALAHGAFNAAGSLYLLLGSARLKPNLTQATVFGWTGWIFPLLVGVVLFRFFPYHRGTSQKLC